MIRKLILFALVALASCGYDIEPTQSASAALPKCTIAADGILAGSCTPGSPLTATVTVDGTTITGTGSAGSGMTAQAAINLIPQNASVGIYGPGTDGALVFDGVATVLGIVPSANLYTMNRDIFATNLTVNSGVTLQTGGYRVFVNGTLTNNASRLGWWGNAAVNATGGSGRTAAVCGGATAGANGTTTAGGSATGITSLRYTWASNSTSNAGAINAVGTIGQVPGKGGGGGGAAAANAGGKGGDITIATTGNGADIWELIECHGHGVGTTAHSGASGGGGGGGNVALAGGGGGGGAGSIVIVAKTIAGAGQWTAYGGAGGAGQGAGAGGGGGGGGGLIVLVYGTRTGSTSTFNPGGTHGNGNGTGKDGGDGAAGTVITLNMSGDGT